MARMGSWRPVLPIPSRHRLRGLSSHAFSPTAGQILPFLSPRLLQQGVYLHGKL